MENEFSQNLKEAISTQNRRDIDRLSSDPLFQKISSEDLSACLLGAGPLMQDAELLPRFIHHPNFGKITPEALAKTFMTAIPIPYGKELQALVNHPQLNNILPQEAEQIVIAALEFQDRRIVSDLQGHPLFLSLFSIHLSSMVQCAIRTKNIFWLDEILKNPDYTRFSTEAFPELIRWALAKKDFNIVGLALRSHHFTPESELFLRQELVDTFLDQVDELAETVVDELVEHPDFPKLSHVMLSWVFFMSILYDDQPLFDNLLTHQSYHRLPPNQVADLIVLAMSVSNQMTAKLTQHPHYPLLSGAELGLILEALTQQNKEIFPLVLQHTHFTQIPEDHFKRMSAMNIQETTQVMRSELLSHPLFYKKYGEMIYESIRRDDVEFLSRLLHDSILKLEVINQLNRYATTDKYFVSEYTIRDILREIFLVNDQSLTSQVIANPAFEKRIPDLAIQSIQFDDEELIETILLHPISNKIFQDVIKKTSLQDRQRIHTIFKASASFNKKTPEVVQAVESWIL